MHRALIEVEILTSSLPHAFAQFSPVLGTGTLSTGVLTPPSGLEMFLCVSGTSKKYLIHRALIEAEILTSPTSKYLLNLAQLLGTGILAIGVSPHPKWSRNVPMCLRNLQTTFGVWDPNRSQDTDLPLPYLFAQLGPVLGAGTLLTGVSTPPKWPRDVSMCLRNLQKNLVHGALIEAEILTSPSPMYLLNLAWFLPTGTLLTGVSTPPK